MRDMVWGLRVGKWSIDFFRVFLIPIFRNERLTRRPVGSHQIVTLFWEAPKHVALKSHSPAQRRTMFTSYPNTRALSKTAHQRAGDAFAALPAHIHITHVLSSRNLPDPSDLARLRAVSRGMRDAVAATGRLVYELEADEAIKLGDLSGMQLLHQRGDLDDDSDSLCALAAGEGQREVLKWLRENDFPWNEETCASAALGGHLEMLQWLRANDCPWDEWTCARAALGGHLEVLQWARANGCPWDERTRAFAEEEGHDAVLEWAIANGASV